MYGWAGQRLRVDLTTGEITKEPLSYEYRRKWIGGRGFNSDVMYNEVFSTTKQLPDGKFSFPKLKADIIYQLPIYKEVTDPVTGEKKVQQESPAGFLINSYDNYGDPQFVDEEGLQDSIYELRGVTETGKKKK